MEVEVEGGRVQWESEGRGSDCLTPIHRYVIIV